MSRPNSEEIFLLKLTTKQAQLAQALQTMGPNAQGVLLELRILSDHSLGATNRGRMLTTTAHVEKYVTAIGMRAYNAYQREQGLASSVLRIHEA